MNRINLQKEWDFVVFETHKEKPNPKNLFKRRLLLIIQVLLDKMYSAKTIKEEAFLKEIYYMTKNRYLRYNYT